MNKVEQVKDLLQDFLWYVNENPYNLSMPQHILDWYGKTCSLRLWEVYCKGSDEPRIRASQLGYPEVKQMLPVLGYTENDLRAVAKRDSWYEGFLFETRMLAFLYTWLGEQKGINWFLTPDKEIKFLGIKGHVDAVLEIEGVKIVLEFKNLNTYYHRRMMFESIPPNDRSYLSQLAIYKEAEGADLALWCLRDWQKRSVAFREWGETEEKWWEEEHEKLKITIPIMKSLNSIQELFREFSPPAPVPWKTKKVNYMRMPLSMNYCPYRKCLYELAQHPDSNVPQVLRVYEPEEIVKNLIEAKENEF